MTESYNTTCMQRHLIDRGTTVPASLRVFTPDDFFQAQFKSTSASTRPDLTFNGSSLMEGRLMNDARFSIRAQAPAVVQSLFNSSSAFCVGGDLSTSLSALSLSLRAAAEFTAASAESLLLRTVAKLGTAAVEGLPSLVSSRSTTLSQWRPCLPVAKYGTAAVEGLLSATCISEYPDYAHFSSSVPLIRVPGHDGMRPCAKSKHGTAFVEGFAFFSVPGSLCDAGWRFLSSSVAITVSADWMRARSYFSFSRTASAKSERFRAVAAFRSVHPTMERALRL